MISNDVNKKYKKLRNLSSPFSGSISWPCHTLILCYILNRTFFFISFQLIVQYRYLVGVFIYIHLDQFTCILKPVLHAYRAKLYDQKTLFLYLPGDRLGLEKTKNDKHQYYRELQPVLIPCSQS